MNHQGTTKYGNTFARDFYGDDGIKETRGQYNDMKDVIKILEQRGWKKQLTQLMTDSKEDIVSFKDKNGQFITIIGGVCDKDEI